MFTHESPEFGAAVTAARTAKGWMKYVLAANIGCDPSTITNCEAGHVPKRRTVRAIAACLDVDENRLLRLAGYAPTDITPQEIDRFLRALRRWRQKAADGAAAQAENALRG